eukprot:COSAG05_NODE_87_length_20404_cov_42.272051_12_plen_82_part_00
MNSYMLVDLFGFCHQKVGGRLCTHVSVRTVHSLTHPSAPVDTSCVPRVQKAMLSTEASWPSNVLRQVQDLTSQILIDASPV